MQLLGWLEKMEGEAMAMLTMAISAVTTT